MDEKKVSNESLMEIDVEMDSSILYDYMLYHTYHGMSGILGTLIGMLMIGYYFGYHSNIVYLIFGMIVIFYLPVNLYMAAKRQALSNPVFKEKLHYRFTDEGIEVSQGDSVDKADWAQMRKAVATGRSIIIYTSKVNATIIPRKACNGQVMELISIIATHMPPKKVKIRQ